MNGGDKIEKVYYERIGDISRPEDMKVRDKVYTVTRIIVTKYRWKLRSKVK